MQSNMSFQKDVPVALFELKFVCITMGKVQSPIAWKFESLNQNIWLDQKWLQFDDVLATFLPRIVQMRCKCNYDVVRFMLKKIVDFKFLHCLTKNTVYLFHRLSESGLRFRSMHQMYRLLNQKATKPLRCFKRERAYPVACK